MALTLNVSLFSVNRNFGKNGSNVNSVTRKNRQMSIKVGDLGKLIVAKGFKKLPKTNKSPDLVSLHVMLAITYLR